MIRSGARVGGASLFPVYLAPVEAQPGLLAVGEHLPQGHAEHPGVRGVGERPGLQTLWSAPEAPQRELRIGADSDGGRGVLLPTMQREPSGAPA